MDVRQIDIADIEIGDRLRDLDQPKLARMVVSFREHGQLSPIRVRAQEGAGKPFKLIFGLHRIRAAQLADLHYVDAIVRTAAEADTDLLEEIDENLARSDLSQYDRANFIAQRARLWESQNGEIKQGRKKSGQIGGISAGHPKKAAFDVATAMQFGINDRDVKRHRSRISKIVPEVWRRLKGTDVADNGAQLDAIARLDADRQRELIELLTGPDQQKFQDAFARVRPSGNKAQKKTPEQECAALWKSYRTASKRAQKLFREKLEANKPAAAEAA